jgi:hypothetical protein
VLPPAAGLRIGSRKGSEREGAARPTCIAANHLLPHPTRSGHSCWRDLIRAITNALLSRISPR